MYESVSEHGKGHVVRISVTSVFNDRSYTRRLFSMEWPQKMEWNMLMYFTPKSYKPVKHDHGISLFLFKITA